MTSGNPIFLANAVPGKTRWICSSCTWKHSEYLLKKSLFKITVWVTEAFWHAYMNELIQFIFNKFLTNVTVRLVKTSTANCNEYIFLTDDILLRY